MGGEQEKCFHDRCTKRQEARALKDGHHHPMLLMPPSDKEVVVEQGEASIDKKVVIMSEMDFDKGLANLSKGFETKPKLSKTSFYAFQLFADVDAHVVLCLLHRQDNNASAKH